MRSIRHGEEMRNFLLFRGVQIQLFLNLYKESMLVSEKSFDC